MRRATNDEPAVIEFADRQKIPSLCGESAQCFVPSEASVSQDWHIGPARVARH
jgi:hypothetical protein